MTTQINSNLIKADKKKHRPFVLAFLIPVAIMVAICIGKGLYPLGDMTFLRTDLYHQYCPFYTDFANRLKNFNSLTYAWDIGLGSNYSALFAYYLSCPTQLFLFIIPESFMIEYITFMIIIKIGLCGYFMAKYLAYKFKTSSLSIVFFACCYALSGYLAAYSWNIMWLDVILLAPLVIMGLEKLINENKPILYCIALAISILTNYYISIMLCIFLMLYAVALLIMLPKQSFKNYILKIARFILYSAIAGALAAILLIPAYCALASTASANISFPSTLKSYFSIITMFSKHFTFLTCETGLEHWPNIYCGVATLIFLPLYYLNKRVSYKDKIVKTILILIMFFSFSLNIPNFIWHGLHYPNSLPARQSYLYIILLLTMCYEGFRGIKKISKGKIAGVAFGVIGYIFICQRMADAEELPLESILLTLLFVGIYAIIIYLYRIGKLKKLTTIIVMLCFVAVELAADTAYSSVSITSRSAYTNDKAPYQSMLSGLNDNSFYRVEKLKHRTKNDGAWIGYDSASIFSSTANARVSDFYKKIGMEGATNAYAFEGATPFTSSMLSVKYLLSDKELPASTVYTLKSSDSVYSLYENNYTLPLGFMMPNEIETQWLFSGNNPALSQNKLTEILGAEGDLLSEIPGNTSGNTFTTSVAKKEHVYVYVLNSSVKNVTAQIGSTTKTFTEVDRGYLLDLGYCEPGISISLSTSDEGQDLPALAYAYDDEGFIKLYNKLAENTLQNITITDKINQTAISGTIDVQKDGQLFMSVPYDEGWTVLVDGKQVTPSSLNKAFMLISLTAGTHNIEMHYTPEGLYIGAIVSLAGLVALALCIIIRSINKKRDLRMKRIQSADYGELTDVDELSVSAILKKAKKKELHSLDDDIELELDDVELEFDDVPIPEKKLTVEPMSSSSTARKKSIENLKKEMKERK